MTELIKSLYSTSDVKQVRQDQLDKQNGCDAITGLPIPIGHDVLDHDHDSQKVRGVLHRQSNVALGRIENMFKRDLKFWYPESLPDFLIKVSKYLKSESLDYFHPGWLKRVQIDFTYLNAKQKDKVLEELTGVPCVNATNDVKRKAKFKSILLTKEYDYPTIKTLIQEVKEKY